MATSTRQAPNGHSSSTPKTGNPRGFAAMDSATQRRIASQGGKASHESGRGHQWTVEEARAAGRKGGQSTRTPRPSA